LIKWGTTGSIEISRLRQQAKPQSIQMKM